MARKKHEFGEGPIFTITNHVYWFFMGNLYFLLCNFPLVMVLLAIMSSKDTKTVDSLETLLFITLIPIGPAATALLSVMGKLHREKSVNITRDYFKAYKTNFLQSIFVWTMELIILRILYVDIQIFRSKNYPSFTILLIDVMMLLLLLSGLYMLPLISRFYLKVKDIVKLSLVYTVRKPHITVLNALSIVATGFIFFKVSSIAILFFASIICYLIMLYENPILEELEEQMNPGAKAKRQRIEEK